MSRSFKCIRPLFMAVAFLLPVFVSGCSVHAGYYDPYYHDYHRWDAHERVYYGQWESETHRPHEDFRKRPADDQKEYWTWRHNHPDQY